VGAGGDAGIDAAPGNGAPAQTVKPLGKGTGQSIVARKDKNAGMNRHEKPFRHEAVQTAAPPVTAH
jgi:hypothetical protein